MKNENYISLKAKNKASFSKKTKQVGDVDIEFIALSESRFDSQTGEAIDELISEVRLEALELEKEYTDSKIVEMQNISDGYKQAISDIKAL